MVEEVEEGEEVERWRREGARVGEREEVETQIDEGRRPRRGGGRGGVPDEGKSENDRRYYLSFF